MHKIERLVAYALFLMPVLWAPASSLAQSPLDGTWRTDMDQYKPSPKPNVFSVNKGMYNCSSCSPKVDVKADGQDQSVTGQSYDTVSVREVDPKSIATTTKKNGKTVTEQTRTVSDDGNTLTVKITSHPENSDQTVSVEVTYTRVGKAPAGAHATSGSWRMGKVKESENGLTTTYKSSGDELSMSAPTGESYTAKLDSKDYPVKGSYTYNSVSLKRVDERTIEETRKRDGKVIGVSKMTVAPDGKKMTVVSTNKLTGRTSTSVAEKQ
jgi:GH15 family glucan-1,4-alpha-glucosidase